MSSEANKQLVEALYEGLNQNVLGVIERYWSQDMFWGGPAALITTTNWGINELVYPEEYRLTERPIRSSPICCSCFANSFIIAQPTHWRENQQAAARYAI